MIPALDAEPGRWKDKPPPDRAWRGRPGLSRADRTAEQDRAAGGNDRRTVDLEGGRTAQASVELKVLPNTRRIRAYLRWSDKGKSPAKYLGEVSETTRARNLAAAWRMAFEQELLVVRGAAEGSWATSPATRRVMRANRSRDTKPELALRSAIHRLGLRFRVDAPLIDGLRRRADVVFPKLRIAVFSDGCYWHGCPQHYRPASQNGEFWSEKIETNRTRDGDTDARLREAGWSVIRVWEHEDPVEAAERIANAVRARATHHGSNRQIYRTVGRPEHRWGPAPLVLAPPVASRVMTDQTSVDPRDRIYDPLRRENLGRSVQWALLARPPVRMDLLPDISGCGIYAIYYTGAISLYEPIARSSFQMPIYVGKADPEGSRKGLNVVPAWAGKNLRKRLGQHQRKLDASQDFASADFWVRYLPADDLFTPIAERLMIVAFRPVWNLVLEGFGVNPQGGRREAQQLRPAWHELHKGVPSFERMTPHGVQARELQERVASHLSMWSRPADNVVIPGVTALTDEQLDALPSLDLDVHS